MAGKLFLSSVRLEDGRLLLGFEIGAPVTVTESGKLRDLPGGLSEYGVDVSRDDDRFEVRALADADGRVVKVIASASPVPDAWHEGV